MPASIEILRVNGAAPGVGTVITNLSALSADLPAATEEVCATNPVQRLVASNGYSYEIWFRFRVATAPSVLVSGLKVWGPATPPDTGVKVWMKTVSSYAQPAVPTDTTGLAQQDTNYYSEEHSLSVGGDLVSLGDVSDFVVVVLEVAPTADTGMIPAFSLSYSYVEQ